MTLLASVHTLDELVEAGGTGSPCADLGLLSALVTFPNGPMRDDSRMVRTQVEECVRDGAFYRVETNWDDETGNAEIREFDTAGALVRRCDWTIWPDGERRDDQIGEAVWFNASGAEVERRPLREQA